MRKSLVLGAALFLSTVVVIELHAAPKTRLDETTQTCRYLDDGPLEWESRPWGQGGKLFQERCKGCHSQGNTKGAPFLWTESKSSAAWNRVFTEKYPACAKDGSWGQMTMEEQMRLNDYLYRWAKNSQDLSDSC